ncbi:MAG: M48 family metallopeptidase [Methanosphaera sp.]|uniref:M48 family metallopeptidase n=1 Tax=Methanosphaera sp. TaxID=2666342 RepID=UPI0025D142F1|nr:M48 family metallopeptidase [Methanosphaera sp.]MCI5867420.1 M48 family metallopeptidase [Methanosphaera sp.]MDD6534512.1 M48 family metallopeptidase [Methanosphaera sp.]MDY3955819.1 M48 family metallopeptidase [Methanosphaera sp.]
MKQIKIKDKTLYYSVEYRDVKYIRFELKYNKLKLILPHSVSEDPEEFIRIKQNYLYRKLCKYDEIDGKIGKIKLENHTLSELRSIVDGYIQKYKDILNVTVGRIQFRDTKYKWGSCSIKNNITFSKDLIYVPCDIIEYVVYHEMVHLIVLDHNDRFYDIMRRVYPDYDEYDEKLKLYEYEIFKNK